MKKNVNAPKNVKKKEVKKEVEAQPQVIDDQADGKDLSRKEAEDGAGKEKVPKASKPKTSKSTTTWVSPKNPNKERTAPLSCHPRLRMDPL